MNRMPLAAFAALLAVVLLSACDCGQGQGDLDAGVPADGGASDGGPTDGGPGDGGATAARPPGVQIVGGGGETASPTHRLRVTIGAPQPMGAASGPTHEVETGPEVGP